MGIGLKPTVPLDESPSFGFEPEELDISDAFSARSSLLPSNTSFDLNAALSLSPLTSISSLSSFQFQLDDSAQFETGQQPPRSPVSPAPASPDSDSDSDSDSGYFLALNQRKMSSTLAIVEHRKPEAIPMLHDGIIDPSVIQKFETAVNDYIEFAEVPADKQVKRAGWGLKHTAAKEWYDANKAEHLAMTLDSWFALLRRQFLPQDWILDATRKLRATRQFENQKFTDYLQICQQTNSLLRGTESYLDEKNLRAQIQSGIHESLDSLCRVDQTHAIKDFKDWVNSIAAKDNNRLMIARQNQEQLARMVRNMSIGNANKSSKVLSTRTTTTTSTDTTFKRLPALTDTERKLLRDNEGCLKCRRPFAGHIARDCKIGFPSPTNYTPVTADVVRKAQSAKVKPRNPTASILTGDSDDDNACSSNIAAAVMPSAMQEVGADYESDSDEYVAPFEIAHFFWPCRIGDFEFTALIDNGAHQVFIDSSLVDRLKLKRHKLHKKIKITLAMQNHSEIELEHWVKIRPSSLDSRWSSRALRAIVSPSLAAPVILGQPFLYANDLDISHRKRTCKPSTSSYDLLNPSPAPVPKTNKPIMSPKKRAVSTIATQKQFKDKCLSQLVASLASRRKQLDKQAESLTSSSHPLEHIRLRIDQLASVESLESLNSKVLRKYADLFPSDIPHYKDMPDDVYHRFHLKEPSLPLKACTYSCPRPLREKWRTLLEQHLEAGRIRPSSSSVSSPAFLIPKKDPAALPRWVNDYRRLNANTVPDVHPLPRIDDVLADCARGKFWAKIDMTNSFFQTKVHPDDIHLTAVTTPFGLYEWTVMPMGCRNAPATHQRRMFAALRPYIGSICHVYLDDIIIWSNSLAEHLQNLDTVLSALRAHSLYCSPTKTSLFLTELDFLGHHISPAGLRASDEKIEKIKNWPVPRNTGDVRSFLGLVRFIASYLPSLAQHTAVLTPLTTNESQKDFPPWTEAHQHAFNAIKTTVLSRECLTTIDYSALDSNSIFVTTDASDLGTGAVLSFGPTLETSRPVAFDSLQLTKAQRNYPVHEKELLAVVRALQKWRTDLIGTPFIIRTDHRTLESFATQKDLSRRQARWQEFLSQYSYDIQYLPGPENEAADALSRHPSFSGPALVASILASISFPSASPSTQLVSSHIVASILQISTDQALLDRIRAGYAHDSFCTKLQENPTARDGINISDGLIYFNNRLVIPRTEDLREFFYRLAHDSLGHFGSDKSYAALRSAYFWPNMRRDLEDSYVKQCDDCQRFKSSTSKKTGPLHPLPVPDQRGDTVCLDFVGPLPEDQGFNMLLTITDSLGADMRLVPCRTDDDARTTARLFFNHWYCENGLPLRLVSDRDKLFTSLFWRSLHSLTGVKLNMSTAFHPQSDGVSERSNKTVVQALRYHVDRHQKGWVTALPRVCFDIMNSTNPSTQFSRFQLHLGRSPRIIPPLVSQPTTPSIPDTDAHAILRQIELDVAEARDNLVLAKVSQRIQADKHRAPEVVFQPGDFVMLNTLNRRRAYMQAGDGRVAKFMPRWEGKYKILKAFPQSSVYELELPNAPNTYSMFHASELKAYHENNQELFPERHFPEPVPVPGTVHEEYLIEKILDHRPRGRGFQYLVRWTNQSPSEDRWLPGSELQDCAALDDYLRSLGLDPALHSHPLKSSSSLPSS